MNTDQLIRLFEERVMRRYYGKYEAVAKEVEDPLEAGRIRATVPAIFGEEELSGWALPCVPYGGGKDRGMLFLPEPGDTVWIEFAGGDISRPIWTGTFWGAPDSAGGADDLATQSGSELPTNEDAAADKDLRVIKTRAGHRIVFDDSGEILIFANGNDKSEIRLTKEGDVIITAQAIKLGKDASEAVVLGDTFKQLFNTHTHPTGVGPSGPPTQQMMGSHLSSKVTTE